MTRHTRRNFLAAAGMASLTAIAGCSGEDESTAEADEPAQNDTQESTEDAEDEEDEEDEGLPTHPVDIRVVDEEGRPRSGMIVESDIGSPSFESPPTDSDGWTHVEIPASIPYTIDVVDGTETWYMASIIHAEPDNEDTEYDRLLVRDAMTVIIEIEKAEEPEVVSP